jgi:hypothetical protein
MIITPNMAVDRVREVRRALSVWRRNDEAKITVREARRMASVLWHLGNDREFLRTKKITQ